MRFSLALAFALAFAASAARAGEVSPMQEGYWFCQTVQSAPTATLYVSDHFEANADRSEVPSAFKKMLAAKYGYAGQVSCSTALKGAGILEKISGDNQRWYGQIRAGGGKVVETHWTFAAEAERLSYQCSGGAEHMKGDMRAATYLYTDVLDMPGSEQAKLSEAWIAHIETLHPGWFFASKGCTLLPADATERKSMIDNMMASWKAHNAELVRLDWKYAPLGATAKPAAVPSAAAAANYYQCWMSDAGGGYYMTDGFPSAKDEAAVKAAWRTHIVALHPPKGFAQIGCKALPADATERRKAIDFNFSYAGPVATRIDWIP